jgi:hypothetical protein
MNDQNKRNNGEQTEQPATDTQDDVSGYAMHDNPMPLKGRGKKVGAGLTAGGNKSGGGGIGGSISLGGGAGSQTTDPAEPYPVQIDPEAEEKQKSIRSSH